MLLQSWLVPVLMSQLSGTPLELQSGMPPVVTSQSSGTPLALQSVSHSSGMPLLLQSADRRMSQLSGSVELQSGAPPVVTSQSSGTPLALQSVSHSSDELATAYTDTLGDLTLGTLGSVVAAVAVGLWMRRGGATAGAAPDPA